MAAKQKARHPQPEWLSNLVMSVGVMLDQLTTMMRREEERRRRREEEEEEEGGGGQVCS